MRRIPIHICALSGLLFNAPAGADVYKLGIKGEANNILRFYAENLDKRTKDIFAVRINEHGNYEFVPEWNSSSSIFTDLVFGEKAQFKIGAVSVSCCSEAGDLRIALSDGCTEDSLILPEVPCSVVIEKDTSLKLNTFVMQIQRGLSGTKALWRHLSPVLQTAKLLKTGESFRPETFFCFARVF